MKPTHYHSGVSGRVRFVTVDSKGWTSDGYKDKTTDLYPVENLIGKEVELNGHRGKIMDVSHDTRTEFLLGKYIGEGKYLRRSDLTQYNDCVRVFWYTGVQPVWQPFFKLKIAMITEEFVEQIFASHTADETIADHAMTTVSAVRGVLLSLARNRNLPELIVIADDLSTELVKRYTDGKLK